MVTSLNPRFHPFSLPIQTLTFTIITVFVVFLFGADLWNLRGPSSSSSSSLVADLFVTNGFIYTSDSSLPVADSMAIRAGRVLRVGNYSSLQVSSSLYTVLFPFLLRKRPNHPDLCLAWPNHVCFHIYNNIKNIIYMYILRSGEEMILGVCAKQPFNFIHATEEMIDNLKFWGILPHPYRNFKNIFHSKELQGLIP